MPRSVFDIDENKRVEDVFNYDSDIKEAAYTIGARRKTKV